MLLVENNPRTYVARIVKDIFTTENISKENKNYIELNKKLRMIDKKLVDLEGNECNKNTFINQSMSYFDSNFQKYKSWRKIMLDAVSNYVITESYFDY